MGISASEYMQRNHSLAAYKYLKEKGEIHDADDREYIKKKALQEIEKQLTPKIKNLQEGEHLSIVFRVDIIDKHAKVRGGSGSQRNMPEYIEWRKAVFERDGYVCMECGSREQITAHHIKSWQGYPDLRFVVGNGVTLCNSCHTEKHPHLKFVQRNAT